MNLVLAFLLFCLVGLDDKPAPKLPLGKDTTYVNGPLDKQGYIDYEAALNAELSRGITAEKNANVLLWKAFGPTPEGGNGMPIEFYKWLDMVPPPKGGDYFIGLGKYGQEKLSLTGVQLEGVFQQQSWASNRPWDAKDYTVIAEWLKMNEKPLALVREATKLPEYYNPLVSLRKEGEPSSLTGALLPSVQKCRELVGALTARAMLRLQEGKADEAWQDILAAHRLGRLVSRGATLIEGLVGIAIGQIAANSTLAYLEQAKLDPKQLADRLKDLRELPPFRPMTEKINLAERFMGLETLQLVRRGKAGELGVELFGPDNPLSADDVKALEKIDWVPAMKAMNKWYDRTAAAMQIQDRATREKEFDKLDEELNKLRKEVAELGNLTKLLRGKDGPDKNAGQAISISLAAMLAPALRKVQTAYDRADQTERNLHVAFALAAYRADNGKYPAKLDDLAPKYLATVPTDLFTGKALTYRPTDKGYLLYSFGPNGKDDEGRYHDDEPAGDDPRVRMPLPPLKKQ